MIENIRLSFRGIWSHKMRSALTMLGIIIGIASIIAIVSIIQSVSNMMKDQLVGKGDNTVSIGVFDKTNMYGEPHNARFYGVIEGITTIPQEKIDAVNSLEGVVKCSPYYMSDMCDIAYKGETASVSVFGVEKEHFSLTNYHLVEGRLLTQADYDKRNNVAVIDTLVANAMFLDGEPIGKTLSVNGELFVVVGVIEVERDYDEINSVADYHVAMQNNANEVYVPSTSWAQLICYDDVQNLLVEIENLDDTVMISTAVADVLNEGMTNEDYQYRSTSYMTDLQGIEMVTDVISILLIGIAGISLVVGGIGVMNIMLVSVTERTREIGLKKALGATRRQIRSQFLTEAAVLTGIGGIIGVLLGVGIALILGVVFNVKVAVSVTSIIVSVVFSMGVGIVFGIMPATKASKLDPIEALRYE